MTVHNPCPSSAYEWWTIGTDLEYVRVVAYDDDSDAANAIRVRFSSHSAGLDVGRWLTRSEAGGLRDALIAALAEDPDGSVAT